MGSMHIECVEQSLTYMGATVMVDSEISSPKARKSGTHGLPGRKRKSSLAGHPDPASRQESAPKLSLVLGTSTHEPASSYF